MIPSAISITNEFDPVMLTFGVISVLVVICFAGIVFTGEDQ